MTPSTPEEEAQLLQQAHQQRLELALAGADLGMWDYHIPTDHHTFNERWASMIGERLDQLDPSVRTWETRVHPDDWPAANAAWIAHANGLTGIYEVEYRLRHKSGRWIWVSSRGKVLERDADGKAVRAAGTHLDITQRKAAEHLMEQRLAHLQSRDNALAAISQGVLITDAAQYITYANKGFESITGYPLPDIIGRKCSFLHGPDTCPETTARIEAALSSGQQFHGEILNYRKDGKTFWNGLSFVPVFADGGKITHYVGVQRDITAQKQADAERAEQTRRIEAMSREQVAAQEEIRRRLSANLHDRTSPNLAAILINLKMLSSECTGPQAAEIAARLEDTRALVEDTAASIREISSELRPPLLDYAGLLPAIESYAQNFSRRTGIEVQVNAIHAQTRLPAALEAALFRIVQEALTNCAKHACASAIEVSVEVSVNLNVELNVELSNEASLENTAMAASRQRIIVAVADNGCGFAPGAIGNPPFTSGLGLINMKETAEFAGGTLRVDAQPGAGTRITVEIHLDSQQDARKAQP